MLEFKVASNQLTLFELKEKITYIDIAKGNVIDKMSRGSYYSKEKITDRRRLFYQGVIDGKHCFKDHDVTLFAQLIEDNKTTLKFEKLEGYNRLWFYLKALPDEKIYGCGEQFTHLNLKHKTVPIWVSEHHSVAKLVRKYLREKIRKVDYDYLGKYQDHASYYAQPTFMSSLMYAVHADSVSYATFTFKAKRTVLYFRQIPEAIHLFKDQRFMGLAQKLNRYIGLQPPLPEWTTEGVILGLQGGLDTIQQRLLEAKQKGIQVKALWVQDWSGQTVTKFGEQVYWNWSLDNVRYQGLEKAIKEWKEEGIHFLGYMNPFLKVGSPQFEEAKEKKYLVKDKKQKPYLIKSTTFKAGIIDLTNQHAYDYYKQLIKKEMLEIGFAGWMADFGEYLPTDSTINEGDPRLVHNQYPELWAQCHQDAINEQASEAFIFTRSAYTKTLKNTQAMWVGDQHVDFSDQYGIGSVIPAYLSMAVSGVGVNHSDTGGYTTIFHMRRSRELFIRWAEMNVFSPLFRTHEGNLPKRNVQYYDATIITLFARLTELYVQLSKYHQIVRKQYYEEAIPMIRPLFYHYDEPFAYENKRQYMYGDSLIVCPVLRPNVLHHTVHLPKGEWIHLITKEVYQGGHQTLACPLGIPTVFYSKESPFKTMFDDITMK